MNDLQMNKVTAQINKLKIPLFFLIIGIWTLPWPYSLPAPGLDPSWVIGIYKAAADNLQFGPDIAFTLGPLGFLLHQHYINHELWFISFIFAIFTHFFLIFSIALLMVKHSSTWKEYVIIVPILIFSIPSLRDYGLLISTGIIFYLVAIDKFDKKYGQYLILFVTFLLAIASLIKFNMMMLSVSIVSLFLFICLFKKESKKYIYIPIIYVAFFAILWKTKGQSFVNIPVYLFNSYQLSTGYNNAMALHGPDEQVFKGLISLIFIIILFSYSLIKKVNNLFIFLFLNSGMFFLAFKHGFVRHDLHILNFMAPYAILFVCIYIIYEKDSPSVFKYISLFLSILLVTSIYSLSPGLIDNNLLQKVPAYESTFSLISNPSYQTQVLENSKNSIKQNYPLDDKTFNYLNNKSIDIFPWDIALVWAYNFTWSPRPVFQSYSAYTEELDSLNAQHFSKEKAPQVVLYAFKSIDGRYPIFDEPATFAAILKNYTFVKRSGEFLILNHDPKENTPMMEHDLGTVKGVIGQPIKIPEYSSGYVYGQIQLEYSLFGKVMTFVYKPALAFIRFNFSNSLYSRYFRYIPGVSMNGVFLSQYIINIDDLESVFSGNITPDIKELVIEVEDPVYYNKYIQVKFIGVPANITIQKNPYLIPQWEKLERKQGGIMAIDSIVNENYAKRSVLLIKRDFGFVDIRGWAADDLAQDGTVRTYLIFKSKEDEVVVPTRKNSRPDISGYFGVKSYERSGWSTTIMPEQFRFRCYNISLRILRANEKEYFELSGNRTICWTK